jgi:hypothetical protein
MSKGLAAAAVGFIENSDLGKKLPQIPLIGRKGTIAIGAYFWAKNGGPRIAKDVAVVAAVLALYQLTKEGRIDGDEDDDG